MKMKDRILDWAKDRNDFFCIHELCDFFPKEQNIISGLVTCLEREGKLTKTDEKASCKRHDRKHSFWIYNKQPKTNGLAYGNNKNQQPDNIKPTKKREIRYGHGELISSILDWLKNRGSEPFCMHDAMDGIKYYNKGSVSMTIKTIYDMGRVKIIEKKPCKKTLRQHLFYALNTHGGRKRGEYASKSQSVKSRIEDYAKNNEKFCCHSIEKELGIPINQSTNILGILEKKKKVARKYKMGCNYSTKKHNIWEYTGSKTMMGTHKTKQPIYNFPNKISVIQNGAINIVAKEAINLFAQWYVEGNWEKGMAKLKHIVEITTD